MYDTYNSIRKIDTSEFKDVELNEVTKRYQNSKDPEFRNKCFAHIFKAVYPMLLDIHHNPKYNIITCEEKTEECLCCTLFAMDHWKQEKGHKISSFIYMVLNSAFKTISSRYQNGNKYKVFNNLITDPEITDFKLKCIPYNSSEKLTHFINDLQDSAILNHDEIEFCKNMLEGYKTNKQIAKQMKPKLLCKYSKKDKKYITVPINTEEEAIKYCGSLRQSIKKKLRENNYNLF